MSPTSTPARKATARFERRLGEILDVASRHMNGLGVRGMTLTAVAGELGLDTSSLTYYFRRKDDLAVACLRRSIERQNEAATLAAGETDTRAAVRRFLHAHFDANRFTKQAGTPVLVLLSDMQSMPPEPRRQLYELYAEGQRTVRRMFEDEPTTSKSLVASTMLLSACHWLPGWVLDHSDSEFKRLENRLFDLLENGLGSGSRWRFDAPVPEEPEASAATSKFLHAATDLINRDGYHGASVEKIAAEMGVSTGSFYHHLDNKDELVMACFQRSYTVIEGAFMAAEELGSDHGQRLAAMVSSLVRLQFGGTSPLLRTSAYQALPPELRDTMMRRLQQITQRIAGSIADAIADGSVRAVDPMVAANFVLSLISGAGELRPWAARVGLDAATQTYASKLEKGIFALF